VKCPVFELLRKAVEECLVHVLSDLSYDCERRMKLG
jgi:hypothetical protein